MPTWLARLPLARLQQGLLLLLWGLAGLWLAWGLALGLAWLALLAGAAGIVLAHAWLLALEFVLLSFVDPGPGVPRPTPRALLRAWWGEVWTGLRVFGWRQPLWWWRAPDLLQGPGLQGRRGVVLVHGFVCNRGLWLPWLKRLRARGVACAAVNLQPVFGSIEDYVATVDEAVARVQAATGLPPLLVAHSMGGLAVRAWLRRHDADARVHHVITIGTPHHGTWLARFAMSANTRQMRRQGPWLTALAAAESPARRARFTCFFSHCDNIVFPASTGSLPGADNRHLGGVAHVDLVFQPAVWSEVERRLAGPEPEPSS